MINALRRLYFDCLGAMGLDPTAFTLCTKPRHDGGPHIEMKDTEYCYVITERGQEVERRRTEDVEEVCYWLIRDVTFDLAVEFELSNRVEGQDSRYIPFDFEERLMGLVSPEWRKRIFDYHESLLRHPYPVPKKVVNKALDRLRGRVT